MTQGKILLLEEDGIYVHVYFSAFESSMPPCPEFDKLETDSRYGLKIVSDSRQWFYLGKYQVYARKLTFVDAPKRA